jgi:hypothetical protein
LYLESELAGMVEDGGCTGAGSCFRVPSDDDADNIRAVQSSMPADLGDAVGAGNMNIE